MDCNLSPAGLKMMAHGSFTTNVLPVLSVEGDVDLVACPQEAEVNVITVKIRGNNLVIANMII
jgi:hypothetical protein